jgi:hypothetical protein
LENSENRRSAGRHGNQHVRLRDAQVSEAFCPAPAINCCEPWQALLPGFEFFLVDFSPQASPTIRQTSGHVRRAHVLGFCLSAAGVVDSMSFRAFTPAKSLWAAAFCLLLLPSVRAEEGIDTEHIYSFMIGTDVGERGEREFQSETTGRFSKAGGSYQGYGQELELEFVPITNFRVEVGTTLAAHNIDSVPGFDDRTQLGWQGASLDLRYRFLDRDTAPFGLTLAMETHGDTIDEITANCVRSVGTEVTLVVERDLIPHMAVATLNLSYQPEWTHFAGALAEEQEGTLGVAFGVMAQLRPGFLLGGEARYFRKYDGISLDELSGQAFFVGPTAYFQLSETARITANWSVQAWGQTTGTNGALDLVNFERYQAKLVFGVNF